MPKDLTDFDIRETVAAACHENWSGWMTHLLGRSIAAPNEQLIIPAEMTKRYALRASTTYDELSVQDKAAIRTQADVILKALSILDNLE